MTNATTPPGQPFTLTSPVEPWVVVTQDDDLVARELLAAIATSGVVKPLDSAMMTDTSGLFAEFADKLEFPPYFGHNWYALVDCLDDLHSSGHGQLPVAVVVEDADPVVDTDFFPLFIALLCEAADRANLSLDADDLPRDRPPFPLHFIFFTKRTNRKQLADRLRERDDLSVHESDDRVLVSSKPD
ncbi:barstar family protein [Kutzneria sp. NPDC051319]|uniref:barstar family protein n=1 Tax=Kutzneria sp. NPDC051319 TaxID=3155047 RepID=UPI00342FB003